MDKVLLIAAILVFSSQASSLDKSSVWTATLPEHSAICASGESDSPEALDNALLEFSRPLMDRGIKSIGYPFIQQMALQESQADAGKIAHASWTICAPVDTGTKAPPGFTSRTVGPQLVAATVCDPPITGCAQRLLSSLNLGGDSPRLATLRSAALVQGQLAANQTVDDAKASLLRALIRTDSVQIDAAKSSANPPAAETPWDIAFSTKGQPRALFASSAAAKPATPAQVETPIFAVISIAPDEVASIGATKSPAASAGTNH